MLVNHRPAPAARETVLTDQRLRHLLRTGRRAAGNLSQKTAAQRAGISSVYWQKIESGTQQAAPASTLAAMFIAARIAPGQLRNEGYAEIASAADELTSMAAAPPTPEEYLAATPDATPEEIGVLQAVWLALKAGRTPDPIGPQLRKTSRRDDTDR